MISLNLNAASLPYSALGRRLDGIASVEGALLDVNPVETNSFTHDDGWVSSWSDPTTGFTLEQSNTSLRPRFDQSGALPCLTYSGDRLWKTNVGMRDFSNADGDQSSMLIVHKVTALTQQTACGWRPTDGSNTRYSFHLPYSNGYTYFDYGNTSGGRIYFRTKPESYQQICAWLYVRNGQTCHIYLNGNLVTSRDNFSTVLPSGRTGYYALGESQYHGFMYRHTLWRRGLSEQEQAQIFATTKSLYGV